MKTINHNSSNWDANNPIQILTKKPVKGGIEGEKEITGVMSINGQPLEVGDIIQSHWIGEKKVYECTSVDRRAAKGDYKVDVSDHFFTSRVITVK